MLKFWLREAIKSIGRTKSSFLISFTSTFIAVTLLSASFIIYNISNDFQERLKESISINLFIKAGVEEVRIKQIESELQKKQYIKSVEYISKEDAAVSFIKETGEDFRSILDYNPLPASFAVVLRQEYYEKEHLEKYASELAQINGIDEAVYMHDYVASILSIINNIKKYVFAFTFLLVIIALYILYSTTKLILNSKREEIETMKLVGAKLSSIKAPIILNAFLTGFLGSITTLMLFLLLTNYFNVFLVPASIPSNMNYVFMIAILLTGPFLGIFASIFALRRINLKV
jgi:cell division transport system permease protein